MNRKEITALVILIVGFVFFIPIPIDVVVGCLFTETEFTNLYLQIFGVKECQKVVVGYSNETYLSSREALEIYDGCASFENMSYYRGMIVEMKCEIKRSFWR